MTKDPGKPITNVWNAPPNAPLEALMTVDLRPPTPEEAAEIRAAAEAATREQAKPYETRVTWETLWRRVP